MPRHLPPPLSLLLLARPPPATPIVPLYAHNVVCAKTVTPRGFRVVTGVLGELLSTKTFSLKALAAQCRNTLKKNVFHLFVNGDSRSSRTATSGRMQHKAPPRLENIASDVVKFLVKQRHDETVANFGLRFRGAAGNAATCIHILAWRVPPPPAQPPRAAGASGQHTWGSGPSF